MMCPSLVQDDGPLPFLGDQMVGNAALTAACIVTTCLIVKCLTDSVDMGESDPGGRIHKTVAHEELQGHVWRLHAAYARCW